MNATFRIGFMLLLSIAAPTLAEPRKIGEIQKLSQFPGKAAVELIEQFNASDENTKLTILQTLGELRAPVAVPFLIENISFTEIVRKGLRKHGTDGAGALVKIGTPSVGPVIEKLKSDLNEDDQWLFSRVFFGVYGSSTAVFVLQEEIGKSPKSTESTRLQTSIELIKAMPK